MPSRRDWRERRAVVIITLCSPQPRALFTPSASSSKPALLVLIDGTWTQAQHMVRCSPTLVAACKRVAFEKHARAIFDAVRKGRPPLHEHRGGGARAPPSRAVESRRARRRRCRRGEPFAFGHLGNSHAWVRVRRASWTEGAARRIGSGSSASRRRSGRIITNGGTGTSSTTTSSANSTTRRWNRRRFVGAGLVARRAPRRVRNDRADCKPRCAGRDRRGDWPPCRPGAFPAQRLRRIGRAARVAGRAASLFHAALRRLARGRAPRRL